MIFKQQTKLINFAKGEANFSFLPTGDIYEFTYQSTLINGYLGNSVDGSSNNIYLRVYDNDIDNVSVYPLIGTKSKSKISVNKINPYLHSGVNSYCFTP